MRYPTDRDPETILVTADLHFGLYPAGDAATLQMARRVRNSEADVFAICGDVGDADVESFEACLELFEEFDGLKLVVPGNHDLWTAAVPSDEKYRRILPAAAADHDFHMLDVAPVTAARVGFIGNIGWYDYSFRNERLNVPLQQYRRKELPGVCSWNDGRFIEWEMSDEQFTEKCVRKLTSAYRAVEPEVHTVLALMHVVPFRELLYGSSTAAYEFSRAYLGSERFGRVLEDSPKVRYAFCGHRHGADHCEREGMDVVCVGSEYRRKRMVELNLSAGNWETVTFDPEKEETQT
ncbi:MAG: metallophosphoesterase [Planctomycetota bacterium]